MKKRVFGLVGATASGKTAVSLALARELHAEILCMDSMQVYRHMDIGTAKPTKEEQAQAKHHMLDLVNPDQQFSVTEYAETAKPLLDQLDAPLLVGGTGFYLRALSLPMDFGGVPGDAKIRAKYEAIAASQGVETLHHILEQTDPVTSARLHPNDVRRVVRALEVFELTGRPFSSQVMPSLDDSPYDFLLFSLEWNREILYERINRRVDEMLENGLLDEVQQLLDMGVSADAQAMQGLGYKELVPVLMGKQSLSQAAELIKQRTRNYAKRQITWFKADKRIHRIEMNTGTSVNDVLEQIMSKIKESLK